MTYPPVPNVPYYDPNCSVLDGWCEPEFRPQMPNPSMGMEAFNDTMLVNGNLYPYLDVTPTTVRFRVLNAANDRFVNLHMYVADSSITATTGITNTEVKMVPALETPDYPATWSTDGRKGGVPDPMTMRSLLDSDWHRRRLSAGTGRDSPQPINWNMNATAFNVGNVTDHSLLLAPAERADVLVDFSQFAGNTLIVYNDAPAAFPALDPRYDYYTGDPDQTDTGGAPTTYAGYAPNTRTVMQIRVAMTTTSPLPSYDLAALQAVFAKTAVNVVSSKCHKTRLSCRKCSITAPTARPSPVTNGCGWLSTSRRSPSSRSLPRPLLRPSWRHSGDDRVPTEGDARRDGRVVRPRLRAHEWQPGSGSTGRNAVTRTSFSTAMQARLPTL